MGAEMKRPPFGGQFTQLTTLLKCELINVGRSKPRKGTQCVFHSQHP